MGKLNTPPRLMRGATAGTAGASGYAPPPAAGDQDKPLHGDGTWRAVTNASAATNAQAAAGTDTATFLTPANAGYSAHRAALAPRPGLISAGTSAAGTTQDNTGLAFGTGDLTGGGWARLADWTPSGATYIFRKAVGATGIELYLNTSGVPQLRIGGTVYSATAAVGATDGAWVFLSFTADRDGNLSFYVNGSLLGTAVSISATSATSLTTAEPLYWFSSGGAFTAGTLGETFIVAGLLSASRIADIYRAGSIAPFCAWTFDSTKGQYVATIDTLSFYQWADFGRADPLNNPVVPDRSGNNQVAVIGTSGINAAVPVAWKNETPRTAIVGDGSNGSFARSTLNTQNPGTGECMLIWEHAFPQDATATSKFPVSLSSSASDANQARALLWAYNTTDGVFLQLYGATTSDYRRLTSTALYTHLVSLGSRGVATALIARRSSAGMRIFLGIGRDAVRFYDVTNLFAETTTGTPPTWASDQIDGAYLHGFYRNSTSSTAHRLYRLEIANVAMTEAQLRTEYERGEPGPEWRNASNTATYTSTYAAGVDSWTTDSGTTATGNVDTIDGQDDWLRVERTGAAGQAYSYRASLVTGGRWYRVTGRFHNPAGSAFSQISVGRTGGSLSSLSTTEKISVTVAAGTTVDFSGTIYLAATAFPLIQASSAGSELSVATGQLFYQKNIVITPLGYTSRLRTDTAAGLTALNGAKSATNDSTDFLFSTTGVTTSPDGRRQIIRPGTLTFTSPGTLNLQLFGASVVDTTSKWRIVNVSGTSNASVNLSLGSASAGTQYVNAQAVTAADFDIATFASRNISGANLWLASSNTATITDLVVVLEKIN